ncbi:MAG: SMR family transporter [Nitrosomonas sp.]|jgi:small multidrug resistance pump|uniref:SMR family transporter n=1 Tax=Nitrosomonas sp. TaxID=42353 RepID=UPI00271B772C|nr:SMR family transporter [Nitrosomonas sp.]MDO9470052.1 SMR family transporter [Nitrosomonas sp.]MDP1549491.1 SMR family transporter [Nitrosomonas sp.]MDP1933813.1 SMR family transporter [Nitrosomonas sp.]MDP2223560.1 SMR family transporter [Nitrosomonas sp.]MDP3282554.1 SMR family transporter [Nitrosomonas sp.]
MQHWIFLAVAIISEVIATSFLKSAEGFTRFWPSVVVVAGYLLAFYLLSLTLKTIPVGVAYAIWSGVGIVLIALSGWLFLGQSLDMPALIGLSLIVAGVAVINVFSRTVAH